MSEIDLTLVDTNDIMRELLRRFSTGVICYTRDSMPPEGKTRVGWRRAGALEACIELMQEVTPDILENPMAAGAERWR